MKKRCMNPPARVGAAFVLLLAAGGLPAQEAPGEDALLPAEPLFHLCLSGRPLVQHGNDLALARQVAEPEMQRFLEPLGAWFEKVALPRALRTTPEGVDPALRRATGLSRSELLDLLGGTLTLTVAGLGSQGMGALHDTSTLLEADLVLTYRSPGAGDVLARLVHTLEEHLTGQDGVTLESLEVEGVGASRLRTGGQDLWYLLKEDLLLVANTRKTFQVILAHMKSGDPAASLAADPAFADMAADVRRPTSVVYAYVGGTKLRELVAGMSAFMAPLQGGSLLDLSGWAWGLSLDGPGLRERMHTSYVEGSPGLVPTQHDVLPALNLVPASAGFFFGGLADLEAGYRALSDVLGFYSMMGGQDAHSVFRDAVGKTEAFLGADLTEEILPALGPQMGLFVSREGGSLIPDPGVLIRVRDRETILAVLERIRTKRRDVVRVKSFSSMGHAFYYADLSSIAGAGDLPPLRPTVVLTRGFLVATPWPQAAKRLVKGLVEETPRLPDRPDFARLWERLRNDDAREDRVTSLTYLDLPVVVGFLVDNLAPLAQRIPERLLSDCPLDPAAIPLSDVFTRHLSGMLSVRTWGPEGSSLDAYSPVGCLMPGVLAGFGAGAAAAWLASEGPVGPSFQEPLPAGGGDRKKGDDGR